MSTRASERESPKRERPSRIAYRGPWKRYPRGVGTQPSSVARTRHVRVQQATTKAHPASHSQSRLEACNASARLVVCTISGAAIIERAHARGQLNSRRGGKLSAAAKAPCGTHCTLNGPCTTTSLQCHISPNREAARGSTTAENSAWDGQSGDPTAITRRRRCSFTRNRRGVNHRIKGRFSEGAPSCRRLSDPLASPQYAQNFSAMQAGMPRAH